MRRAFSRVVLVLGWSLLPAGVLAADPVLRLAPCGDRECVVLSLETEVAAALAARGLGDEEWRAVLTVRTEVAAASEPPGPGLFGSHLLEGADLRFRPRLPFLPGTEYRATVDAAALSRLAGGSVEDSRESIELAFQIPVPERTAPRVLAIHPPAGEVPGNLLRAYVEFSQSMRPDVVSHYLRLVDQEGEEVEMPFVEIDGGLWDPGRRRLTLLFHPGRLKRGVAPREKLGPPLVTGREYRLEIASGWPASTGQPLEQEASQSWLVGSDDRRPVTPESWRLDLPAAGTLDPLRIGFGEPLDHALALRMIAVFRNGVLVAGSAVMSANDAELSFTPAERWTDAEYQLRVRPALEDLAGNNLRGVFDRGEAESEARAVAAEIPFRPYLAER